MNFRELAVFVQTVRGGSLTEAGEQLGMAKSGVSTHLKRLEDRLGVKLLHRSARRLALTWEGERLLPRIESLLAEGGLLLEEARERVLQPSGALHIAAPPEFGALLAERFLPLVEQRYPALRLVMKLAYGMEDLQAPTFDLAFRIGRVRDDRIVARPLGRFRRVLVASPEFLERHSPAVPEDLERFNCLIFSASTTERTWTLVNAADDRRRVGVRGRSAVQSFTALLRMAEAGQGIAFLPEFMVREALQHGRLRQCLGSWRSEPSPVWVGYRFGSERIGRIAAVIDLARDRVPAMINPVPE